MPCRLRRSLKKGPADAPDATFRTVPSGTYKGSPVRANDLNGPLPLARARSLVQTPARVQWVPRPRFHRPSFRQSFGMTCWPSWKGWGSSIRTSGRSALGQGRSTLTRSSLASFAAATTYTTSGLPRGLGPKVSDEFTVPLCRGIIANCTAPARKRHGGRNSRRNAIVKAGRSPGECR